MPPKRKNCNCMEELISPQEFNNLCANAYKDIRIDGQTLTERKLPILNCSFCREMFFMLIICFQILESEKMFDLSHKPLVWDKMVKQNTFQLFYQKLCWQTIRIWNIISGWFFSFFALWIIFCRYLILKTFKDRKCTVLDMDYDLLLLKIFSRKFFHFLIFWKSANKILRSSKNFNRFS